MYSVLGAFYLKNSDIIQGLKSTYSKKTAAFII